MLTNNSEASSIVHIGASHPLNVFQRMLSLNSAASSVIPLGLLHMRPLQFWLNAHVPSHTWRLGCLHFKITHRCIRAVAPWKAPCLYQIKRMETTPPSGSENMVCLREDRGGPLCLRRQLSLPNLFLKGVRCSGPLFAKRLSACLPSDCPAPSDLLSQARGMIWQPQPELWSLHV